jgi:hypothetical protein
MTVTIDRDILLFKITKTGEIERVKRGVYAIPGTVAKLAAKNTGEIGKKDRAVKRLSLRGKSQIFLIFPIFPITGRTELGKTDEHTCGTIFGRTNETSSAKAPPRNALHNGGCEESEVAALVARGYLPDGTFHKISAKYMPLYVAEFQFRYNNRQ